MRYIVEVPVYVRVELNATDAEWASARAQRIAERNTVVPFVGEPDVLMTEVVPLDETEEDREPDVYVCRGGKLNQVGPGDLIEPLDEDC